MWLGYRRKGKLFRKRRAARNEELIIREDFNKRKAVVDEQRRQRLLQLAARLASEGKDLSKSPLLQVQLRAMQIILTAITTFKGLRISASSHPACFKFKKETLAMSRQCVEHSVL